MLIMHSVSDHSGLTVILDCSARNACCAYTLRLPVLSQQALLESGFDMQSVTFIHKCRRFTLVPFISSIVRFAIAIVFTQKVD